MHFRTVAIVVALSVLGASPWWLAEWLLKPRASACCMMPRSYPGDVDQTKQEVVVLHHDRTEELVLRVNPHFPGATEGPEHLAWIVTVPSPPTAYAEADPAVFTDAERLAAKLLAEQAARERSWLSKFDGADSMATKKALIVDPTVRVGQFEITPVRAKSGQAKEGAAALNTFLDERGYPAESPEELEWFTTRGFTFLCVQVFPPEGQARFGSKADTPALRITFNTDKPYYPAKYSARQGEFALGMTVLTSRPLKNDSVDRWRTELASYSQGRNLLTSDPLPNELGKLVASSPLLAEVDRWYVTPLPSNGFNSEVAPGVGKISQWEDDVIFELGAPPRESRVAILIATAIAGAGIGALLGLKLRKRKPTE